MRNQRLILHLMLLILNTSFHIFLVHLSLSHFPSSRTLHFLSLFAFHHPRHFPSQGLFLTLDPFLSCLDLFLLFPFYHFSFQFCFLAQFQWRHSLFSLYWLSGSWISIGLCLISISSTGCEKFLFFLLFSDFFVDARWIIVRFLVFLMFR